MPFESKNRIDDIDRISEIHRILVTYPGDGIGRVSFTDVIEGEFAPGVLAQYAVNYIDGFDGYPKLAEGFDITGDVDNWRSLMIDPDDALTLKDNIQKYKSEQIASAIFSLNNSSKII